MSSEAAERAELIDWLTDSPSPKDNRAAKMLDIQAARIAELEAEIANLHTTMMAAAVEIHEHWDAHCDAEGYGPANLMHRLERGIASQYGYDAKTLQRVEAERDTLRAEVERLRPNARRYEWLRDATNAERLGIHDDRVGDDCPFWLIDEHADTAIDRAIEAAKEAK